MEDLANDKYEEEDDTDNEVMYYFLLHLFYFPRGRMERIQAALSMAQVIITHLVRARRFFI